PVRVPNAARYCLHKLIVATLRASRAAAKADKDIAQSAVLAAVLTEKFEGDLLQAARKVPAGARKRLAQSARRAAALLADRHAPGRDFLEGLVGR
ncbi:MAG: GSU2403 family nucleotidyltransferase fold protein, partial [Burkholderiales bacterium]